MEVGYLITVLILFFRLTGVATSPDEFVYTRCTRFDKEERCLAMDEKDFILGDDVMPSKWPDGPYALLTPNEGCPESDSNGWRRGHLSFSWQDHHTLKSAGGCGDETNNDKQYNTNDKAANPDNPSCFRNLATDAWPYLQSNLLGPFSEYALRLNFCCKDKRNVTNGYEWPSGSFVIFGDASGCPEGFDEVSRKIDLPMIKSWTSYGCHPDFTVNETELSTVLQMKLCIRLEADIETVEGNHALLNTTFPFILIKTENETCTKLQETNVMFESLRLDIHDNDSIGQVAIFNICYYRSKSFLKDVDSYIYIREKVQMDNTFVVSNPSMMFGNKSIAKAVSISRFNDLFWSWQGGNLYERTTIPWLMLDLGRNIMVSGLQIINHFGKEVINQAYTGTLNVTSSGTPCQRWDTTYPHSHSYMLHEDLFPDESVNDAENYCRSLDYGNCTWCYTRDQNIRWGCCAFKVYKIKPFSKCFIGEERWRVQDFGSTMCPYKIHRNSDILYYSFLRDIEGRYITLVGSDGSDLLKFQTSTVVKVSTRPELLYNQALCNIDLGLIDGSVRDEQITASSWQSMYPPSFVRPFNSGWCANPSDKNPYVQVDMMVDTEFEGITVWNWYETVENVVDGVYTKKVISKGVTEVLVYYYSDIDIENKGFKNMTFKLHQFLPVDQPQTFFHQQTLARYIEIHIVKSVNPSSNCLRFELLGCRKDKKLHLPELIDYTDVKDRMEPYEKMGSIKFMQKQYVITNIAYPTNYRGGVSYTWIIDLRQNTYVELLFTNISFNIYEKSTESTITSACSRDTLELNNAYTHEDGLIVDQRLNGLVSLIQSDVTFMSLTFTSCLPTSRILSHGAGFKAIINSSVVPTCFSVENNLSMEILNYCNLPTMYLTSVSRLNIPYSNSPEKWIIHVRRFSIHLKVIYFNVRCDSGSSLTITDRFSGGSTYCNLNMIPMHVYSDSDTLEIDFDKGPNTRNPLRISAREGFHAVYNTNYENMTHLIDSFGTNFQVVYHLYRLGIYGYGARTWYNATLLAYKGCSKTFGKCYSVFYRMGIRWATAGNECWIRQQRLVSIHYTLEQQLLKYMLRNFRYVDMGLYNVDTAFPQKTPPDPYFYAHIGLTRVRKYAGEQFHIWEDGSPVTYTAWNTGEPSSAGDCTRMSFHLAHKNKTWEAESCSDGRANYFICEEPITNKLLNLSDSFYPHLYNGTLNYTVDGIPCQRWEDTYPHYHGFDVITFKTSRLVENYCRDPEFNGYIWCFTLDPRERWQKCPQPTKVLESIFPNRYTGRLSKTSSGRTCQRWDSQEPHRQNAGKSNSSFPDNTVKDASNYCRDPTEEGTLYCYTTDREVQWEPCNYKDTASDRCYMTLSAYVGEWNKTLSGKECQHWSADTPHRHDTLSDSQFPDGSVTKALNYCRDPYNEGFLWCFTTDPAVKSEPCVFNYKYMNKDDAANNEFAEELFECRNGDTIPIRYLCDGKQNCMDFSDETSCFNKGPENITTLNPSTGRLFTAATQALEDCCCEVHELLVNKTRPHDLTGHREKDRSLFQCKNKEWTSMLARCDGVIDCLDATDEINCSKAKGAEVDSPCSVEQFACEDNMCIHISQMCDFVVDCVDASDENCDYPQCSAREFRCSNGQCIPNEKRCDAYEHCIDGTDENSCDFCKQGSFHCDLVRCIPNRLVCDKYPDCKDGNDEMSCDQPFYLTCEEWWDAGYRKNGIYRLDLTDAECDFESMPKDGKIFTTFHNFESSVMSFYEQIHSTAGELFQQNLSDFSMDNVLENQDYTCVQNITQICTPAQLAVVQAMDSGNQSTSSDDCTCIVLSVMPYRYFQVASYCNDTKVLSEEEQDKNMLFVYTDWPFERLMYVEEEAFSRNREIQIGPIVCEHNHTFPEISIGCDHENNVFPSSVKCIYDTDPARFVIGCRSGKHLQGCENFECPAHTVKCPRSFCLPLRFVCDGVKQCPDGADEGDCGCQDNEREVIIMYENNRERDGVQQMRNIANKFYTQSSIVRLLQYKTRIYPDKLNFEHRMLDISDEVVKPDEIVMRQFVCNYSILASEFINYIQFSKNGSKGVIFIQDSEESEHIADMMFGGIKSRPDFYLYRVLRGIQDTTSKDEFHFVTDVMIKRWDLMATIGATFFPQLCQVSSSVYCPGKYKCAASKKCILLEQVCDGQRQCFYGDDERLCQYTCPNNCKCSEYTTNCSYTSFDNTTWATIHTNSRFLDLNGNPSLPDVMQESTVDLAFPYLISLYMSNCEILLLRSYEFQSLINLRILDLSYNKISNLPMFGFVGLRKLTSLNLLGNTNIYRIEPYALQGMQSLRTFRIVGANINFISANAFAGLRLDILNLTDNTIYEMEDQVFGDLNAGSIDFKQNVIEHFQEGLFKGVTGLTMLHTPSYKYCCIRPNSLEEEKCFPHTDEFSSCEDLLRLSALQTMLWLIGLCALFGNILSVLYRLVYHKERLKLSYEIFVTNLALADALMGIYLLIIAIADAVYRKRYIFMDDKWRNSGWCAFAGFLSTVSSEASVFFLCLITLDRFLVIKYPFGQIRLRPRHVMFASLFSWSASVLIALVPIVFKNYFHGKFYSKSGVCIALPLTRDRPPGWLYSVVIFVGLNFVTFCLIAWGQASIYMEIKKTTSAVKLRRNRRSGHRNEIAVARNLLLVVTTDFLCWFPIGCLGFLAMLGYEISGDVYAWTTVFILPVNSALNPVLYTLSVIKTDRKQNLQIPRITETTFRIKNAKRCGQLPDLFRYLTLRDDSTQTFISLNAVMTQKLGKTTIVKMSMQLAHCLYLLHKNSLLVDHLDAEIIYVSAKNGEVVGDIQIRKEPIFCRNANKRRDDIYTLGTILQKLVMLVQDNKPQTR